MEESQLLRFLVTRNGLDLKKQTVFFCLSPLLCSTSRQSFPITLETDLQATQPCRSSSKVSRDSQTFFDSIYFIAVSNKNVSYFITVLRAIVEDSPTVPTLLTDYILKGILN